MQLRSDESPTTLIPAYTILSKLSRRIDERNNHGIDGCSCSVGRTEFQQALIWIANINHQILRQLAENNSLTHLKSSMFKYESVVKLHS